MLCPQTLQVIMRPERGRELQKAAHCVKTPTGPPSHSLASTDMMYRFKTSDLKGKSHVRNGFLSNQYIVNLLC